MAKGLAAQAAAKYAADQRAKQEAAYKARFTDLERQFLYAIAGKAVKTIDISAKNAKQQLDCIVAYKANPARCPQGRDLLEITKKRYAEYRQAYALGHMKKFNQYRTLPGTPPSNIVATPYSSYYLDYAFNEADWINKQRELDVARFQRMADKCDFTDADIDMFYQSRVTQIITSTPVVLLIKVISDDFFSIFKGRKYLPEDDDVVLAYQRYVESLANTRKTFAEANEESLDGLFMYQMLAAQVIQDNSAKWLPVFNGLNQKLVPQTTFDSFVYWAKNTIFSLNTLFIGCAVTSGFVVGTTGFIPAGILAGVCTTAAAGLAANTLIQDLSAQYQMQEEWMAGIRDRGSVEAMRVRVQVDVILLAFNLYAMKAITPASIGLAPAVPTVEELLAKAAASGYSKAMIEVTTKDFVKETSIDAIRGELIALGFGAAYRELMTVKDLDRVSQVSADILFQYQKTGTYTFSSQADVVCAMKAMHQDLADKSN